MQNTIQAVKAMLQRNGADNSDDEYVAQSETKLTQILQEALLNNDGEAKQNCIEAINAFISVDDIAKRKLQAFCLYFIDPTIAAQQPNASGEQIQQHKFLQEDELLKLYNFVKRHSADKSFGDIVYKIIDKHGMTPPEVYKNAMLRRQDFSRATDPKAKNVTRQLAWQIIIGLHCSLDEADEVLFSAGFIRRNNCMDLTMKYFIQIENYDVMAINEVLYGLGVKPFSCYKPVSDNDNI